MNKYKVKVTCGGAVTSEVVKGDHPFEALENSKLAIQPFEGAVLEKKSVSLEIYNLENPEETLTMDYNA